MGARMYGGTESMFADDLNMFQQFDGSVSNEAILRSLQQTQHSVHKWGDRFLVSFDAGKEHAIIIHPIDGQGETFKFVENYIDVHLNMDDAISRIVAKCKPKITAMLRTRGKYSQRDMLNQYKTHIWGHSEFQNGCILH